MPDHKKATHGTPAGVKKHKDHDLITKRMNDYIEVYKTKNTDALMEFYAKDDGFQYSDFCELLHIVLRLTDHFLASGREAMDLKEIKAVLDTTFNSFYDLDIKTLSLHGHKDFTAWVSTSYRKTCL